MINVFAPSTWLSRPGQDQSAAASASKDPIQKTLLDLVRVDALEHWASQATEPGQGIDWPRLLELAYREGMAPLVHHTLAHTGLAAGGQAQRFNYLYQLTRRRNAQAGVQLREALLGLESEGIEAIVLKGAALMSRVYPDPGLRPFADIDILVRQRDLAHAHRVLVDLGYDLNYQGKPIASPSRTDVTYRSARQYFRRDANCLSFDLYWQLARYPYLAPLDYEGLWQRAQRVTLEDTPALVLSPEDAVLHHSLDFTLGVCYGHPELKSLRDIGEIAHREEIDWAELTARAGRSALAAPLYFSCALAGRLLGAPVPQEALERMYPGAARQKAWVLGRLESNIFGGGHPLKYGLLVALMRLTGPESPWPKAGWLAHLALPPRDLWGSVPGTLHRVFLGRSA
jgi:hypothetical protein